MPLFADTPNGNAVLGGAALAPTRYGAWGGLLQQSTFTGRNMTPQAALGIGAAYACITLRAEVAASLTLETHIKGKDGSRRQADDSQSRMISETPNNDMTAFTLWSTAIAHKLGHGNAYIAKLKDSRGRVVELYPLLPDYVTVFRGDDGRKRFYIQFPNSGQTATLGTEDILHIHGLSFDIGLVGHSPVAVQRNRMGVGLAQIEHQARLFKQGVTSRGVMTVPGVLDDEVMERIRAQWRTAHEGVENSHSTIILEQGASYQPIAMSSADAQFIEQMNYNDTDIARIYRVPPYLIGANSGGTLRYDTMQANDETFAKYTVRMDCKHIETSLKSDVDLFGPKSNMYPKFDTDELLRANMKSRFETYAVGLSNGFLDVNEVRDSEDLAPLPLVQDVDSGDLMDEEDDILDNFDSED